MNIHSVKIIELFSHLQVFFEKTLKYDENHLVRWVIGSFGVCLCVGLCEGANPKCANAGWLKLFFKMCGGKIFKTLRWVSVGKMVWSVSSYSEIVNEFLSPENLFGSQKSGRFGVRLIVARSSFRLAYNVSRLGEVADF